MTTKSQQEAYQYWLDSPILNKKRSPTGPFDFGDEQTIGLHLKRVNYKIDNKEDFGLYLGQHDDTYVVAIKSWDYQIIGAECFNSLDNLKAEWQLD